jgi:hypothetical protein
LTGHAEFDVAFRLVGRRDELLAVLDVHQRRRLLRLLDSGLVYWNDGGLVVHRRELTERVSELRRWIFQGVEVVEGFELSAGDDVVETLLGNQVSDPVATVRVANMWVLWHDHGDHPEVRLGVQRALFDSDWTVRREAAVLLGESAHRAWLDTARDEAVPLPDRARALVDVVRSFSTSSSRELPAFVGQSALLDEVERGLPDAGYSVTPPGLAFWLAACAELGLRITLLSAPGVQLWGRVEGRDLLVECRAVAEGWRSLIRVRPSRGLAPIGLWPEDRAVDGSKAADVRTHDPALDAGVVVVGDEHVVSALMDRATRREVRRLVEGLGVWVEEGAVGYAQSGPFETQRRIRNLIRGMIRLSDALQVREGELVAKLAENARRDSLAPVRRHNLEVLVAMLGAEHEAVAEVLAAAKRDPALMVRLAAAKLGGDRSALGDLAEDRSLPLAARLEALDWLLFKATADARSRAILEGLFNASDRAAQEAAVRRYAWLRDAAAAVPVAALMGVADPGLANLCADTLIAMGPSDAEPSLLAMLALDNEARQLQAVNVLAAVGTRRAVEPLRALTRGFFTGPLGEAAEAAIQRIQRRVGGSGGRLSLAADGSGGELSVSGDPGGLSVNEPEAGERD